MERSFYTSHTTEHETVKQSCTCGEGALRWAGGKVVCHLWDGQHKYIFWSLLHHQYSCSPPYTPLPSLIFSFSLSLPSFPPSSFPPLYPLPETTTSVVTDTLTQTETLIFVSTVTDSVVKTVVVTETVSPIPTDPPASGEISSCLQPV